MINLTDRVMIIKRSGIDSFIRGAMRSVILHLEERYEDASLRNKSARSRGIQKIFGERSVRQEAVFDESFLTAVMDFLNTGNQHVGSRESLQRLCSYSSARMPAASSYAPIKQGLKLLLVELWNRGAILLPMKFVTEPNFNPMPITNELMDFSSSFKGLAERNRAGAANPRQDHSDRITRFMSKVLFAASWKSITDFDIYEYSALHRAQLSFSRGLYNYVLSKAPVPWSGFLNELIKAFPDRVRFSIKDIQLYSKWTLGQHTHAIAFDAFLEEEHLGFQNIKKKSGKVNDARPDPRQDELERTGKSTQHSDALAYFSTFFRIWPSKKFSRINCHPVYPGREHVSDLNKSDIWRRVILDYLDRRKRKGYESEVTVITSLNVFADYLFLYLPWWKEIYPESKVKVPESPRELTRFPYIERSPTEKIDQVPLSFIDILKLRRGAAGSEYAVIKAVQLFFQYVEAAYHDDEVVAGVSFRNPIHREFDFPKLEKKGKTTKVVFPKRVYGYLVHYVYALEGFGQYLYEACLDRRFDETELKTLAQSRWIDAEQLGLVPFISFRGRIIPMREVPNVFFWDYRVLKQEHSKSIVRFLPHLTNLRLLIVAIETGLRLASLRWLDIRSWNSAQYGQKNNSQFSMRTDGLYVFDLLVNTDKSKNKPWTTHIVYRVHSTLLREEAFQKTIDEERMALEIPYQNRPNSRFAPVVPLFRSGKEVPVTEKQYRRDWLLLLIGFQIFYRSIDAASTDFVKISGAVDNDGAPREYVDSEGLRSCPIIISPINTPHACRATFATNRQGMMETSDIALLIGHESERTTEHYQSPRAEDLKESLERSDRMQLAESRGLGFNEPIFVHADKQNSNLVRSFSSDRELTVKSFGFMPPISLWDLSDTENLSENELEELRSGPMSSVRFRETHICPVGEECPADIVKAIGGFKRCGMCPLAMKCVDHLPAIAAKKSALLERIGYLVRQREDIESNGDFAAAEDLWEEAELDTNEFLGWQFSEEVLLRLYKDALGKEEGQRQDTIYLVDKPEIVQRHLQRVVKKTNQVEFMLHRIIQADAYPSMQSPQVQIAASRIRRSLIAGRDHSNLLGDFPGPKDVSTASSLILSIMRTRGMTIEDIGKALAAPTGHLELSKPALVLEA